MDHGDGLLTISELWAARIGHSAYKRSTRAHEIDRVRRLSPRRGFPSFQVNQRVDRIPALGLPAANPHLEVQMRPGGVAGLADLADCLTRRYDLSGADGQRRRLTVGVEEVEPVDGVLGGIPTRAAGLVGGRDDRAAQGRDHLETFAGEHVLALVDVAFAGRPEAVFGIAEAVRTEHGEHGSFGHCLRRRGSSGRRAGGDWDGWLWLRPRLGLDRSFRLGRGVRLARGVRGLARGRLGGNMGLGHKHPIFATARALAHRSSRAPVRRARAPLPTRALRWARAPLGVRTPPWARARRVSPQVPGETQAAGPTRSARPP